MWQVATTSVVRASFTAVRHLSHCNIETDLVRQTKQVSTAFDIRPCHNSACQTVDGLRTIGMRNRHRS